MSKLESRIDKLEKRTRPAGPGLRLRIIVDNELWCVLGGEEDPTPVAREEADDGHERP